MSATFRDIQSPSHHQDIPRLTWLPTSTFQKFNSLVPVSPLIAPSQRTSKDAPRVTVVMTAYNAMPYLPSSVDSILNQTMCNFRMIVVNDGSIDTSIDYLNSIDDPRVQVIHQENLGQQAAANLAIEQAETEFIARMDADDIAMPDRLAKQIRFLDTHPEVGLVGSQFQYLGKRGVGVRSSLACGHQKIYHELIHNRHAICNCTTMFRTDLFRDLGGYWEHNISEDWDWFLRAGEEMALANLPEPLIHFRLHPTSINARRMVESQLHNEFACELARRRQQGLPKISFKTFCANHRFQRWPSSLLFKMDCYSIEQYRVAVANIVDRRLVTGYSRLAWSMLCSPSRGVHRLKRMLASDASSLQANVGSD